MPTIMNFIDEALAQLAPGLEYVNRGDYIEWYNNPNPPTWDMINAKMAELQAEEPMRQLREERDRRLMACDYIVVKSIESGKPVPQAWLDYRQALRDLPSNSSPQCWPTFQLKLDSIGWPTPPGDVNTSI